MPNIFISGGASGLGKAFCHAYAERDPSSKIYVLDRAFPAVNASGTFLDLPQPPEWISEHIVPIECDVTNSTAIDEKVGKLDVKFDLVIHSAGVRGLVPSVPLRSFSDVAKADSLEIMDSATLMRTFEINAVGTFLLLRALLPLLRRSVSNIDIESKASISDPVNPTEGAKVVVMGSRMGSIGHNKTLGGAYAYRASKAALNAIVKSFSVDVPDVSWTVMHPGRVETGLVATKEDDAMNVQTVVYELVQLIDGLTEKDSGRFIDRFGDDIQW